MDAESCVSEKTQNMSSGNSANYEDESEEEYVHSLFGKRFLIADNECYSLPSPKSMFTSDPWNVDELQTLKSELNGMKNLLNNYNLYNWHHHTQARNSAKDVMVRLKKDIEPEFLTQAWCKFYEVVSSFPLVPIDHIMGANKRFKSIHLCEAPGAFVTSLNHWLKTNVPDIQWDWVAITLNPYYEGNPQSAMIGDDRFIRRTLDHWYFGKDGTGNLMTLKNLDELVTLMEPRDEILLITADGSIDCIDTPGEQENVVAHLHFSETVAALHLLAAGGSFLLKLFTIFEHSSVCLLYLLSCCFGKVNVMKPVTSKEGNSETYVVCTNFKGPKFISLYLNTLREHYESRPNQTMFCKDDIPRSFVEKIIKCSDFFKSHQCSVIMKNVFTFELKIKNDVKQIQRMVAEKYISTYNLRKLTSGEIVGKAIFEGSNSINICKRQIQASYNERCMKQHLTPLDQLREFVNDCDKIKVSLPTNKCISFKPITMLEDLEIRTGKMFCKVCSSRFCNSQILKMYNDVNDIILIVGLSTQFPSMENVKDLEKHLCGNSEHKALVFLCTDPYDSHKIVTKFYDTLQTLENGDNLVLVGYLLLTHFNAGLFSLVSCAFDSFTVELRNDVGVQITFKHYNYNSKILKCLIDITCISANAKKNLEAVLQIFPASFLHESALFFTIVNINHWMIKTFVHYVSSVLENSSSGNENKT